MRPIQRDLQRSAFDTGLLNRMTTGALLLPVLTICVIVGGAYADAQTFSTLHSFNGDPDGALPYASLVRDAAGNLYGTTGSGGTNNGTVFEVSAAGVESVLYTFKGKADGGSPSAQLIRDGSGNLYGTASYGGAYKQGTVFEISTTGRERVLHSFSGPDGANPSTGVIFDAAGNLYGTTESGGSGACVSSNGQKGCGTVFKLSPGGNETVLHSFAGGSDGATPGATLVRDGVGNFYGITTQGGGCSTSCGTIFAISKTGAYKVIHSFSGPDGALPTGLITGPHGNLYGTTIYGGAYSAGNVYEVSPAGAQKVLYSFGGVVNDGTNPVGILLGDASGGFYGATKVGGVPGCSNGCGTIFHVTTDGTETVVYDFGTGTSGFIPFAGLIRDSQGNLYGTTGEGGTDGLGTVFEFTP